VDEEKHQNNVTKIRAGYTKKCRHGSPKRGHWSKVQEGTNSMTQHMIFSESSALSIWKVGSNCWLHGAVCSCIVAVSSAEYRR
jgi:hypothetical protein